MSVLISVWAYVLEAVAGAVGAAGLGLRYSANGLMTIATDLEGAARRLRSSSGSIDAADIWRTYIVDLFEGRVPFLILREADMEAAEVAMGAGHVTELLDEVATAYPGMDYLVTWDKEARHYRIDVDSRAELQAGADWARGSG